MPWLLFLFPPPYSGHRRSNGSNTNQLQELNSYSAGLDVVWQWNEYKWIQRLNGKRNKNFLNSNIGLKCLKAEVHTVQTLTHGVDECLCMTARRLKWWTDCLFMKCTTHPTDSNSSISSGPLNVELHTLIAASGHWEQIYWELNTSAEQTDLRGI